MKKLIPSLLFILLASNQAFSIDFFKGSYQSALQKAKDENKKVLLYFTATWCGPCQYMQKYIFPSPTLTAFVNTKYVALKLDIDTQEGKLIYEKVHQPRALRGVPAYVIINSQEEIIKTAVGGMKENQLQAFLTTDKSENVMYKALADSLVAKQIDETPKINGTFSKFIFDTSFSNWKPGIKLGTNLMGFKGTHHNHDVTVGYQVGVFFSRDYKPTEEKIGFWSKSRYDLQVGLTLSSKGGTFQINEEKAQVNIHYLELEVPNNYAIKGFHGIKLSVAPYASVALWGSGRTDRTKESISLKETLNNKDFGLKLGASKNYGSFKAYFGYDLGLKDIRKDTDKVFNRGFYFSGALILGK